MRLGHLTNGISCEYEMQDKLKEWFSAHPPVRRCQECFSKVPDGATSCPKCGAPFSIVCNNCGWTNPIACCNCRRCKKILWSLNYHLFCKRCNNMLAWIEKHNLLGSLKQFLDGDVFEMNPNITETDWSKELRSK